MLQLFNPRPRVEVLSLAPGLRCIVLDDVLLEPESLVEFAGRIRLETPAGNLYPGLVAGLSMEFDSRLRDLFWLHARGPLGLRRCQAAFVRLSMATLPAAQLQPLQWLCHRDRIDDSDAGALFAASVLYLFRNPALGGTRFFVPRASPDELAALLRDAETLAPADFTARHGVAPGYPAAESRHFEAVATVPAAWNRMIIYDGGRYHCAAIDHPELLSDDPAHGRLTVNGFFPCRRSSAPA
jgi:hypothetical protein